MVTAIILIVLTLLHIPSAIISGRNEARIKAQGGREYGQTHSRALIVVQFLIYVGKKRLSEVSPPRESLFLSRSLEPALGPP
ncbi:hypothetical protein [Paenibacillus rubinfantis]|uniref:hypothetical protein n=1 Tax=Paenibacillus rubinfantis TaxID=1720296 RepID=UPI00073F0BF6|nr:hypothetical protein [Paenibacillus rubinfantis]